MNDNRKLKFEIVEVYEDIEYTKAELIEACKANDKVLIAEKLSYLAEDMNFKDYMNYVYEIAKEGENDRLFEVLVNKLDNNPAELRNVFRVVCLKKIHSEDVGKALRSIERYINNKTDIKRTEYFSYIANSMTEIELSSIIMEYGLIKHYRR